MRTHPSPSGPERDLLDDFLDFHRETLLEKCMDLSPEQLGLRSAAPSQLSLHGLVRHLARIERWWFRICMCDMSLPGLFVSREHPDGDFEEIDPARWADDLQVYRGEVAAARDAVLTLSLDDEAARGPHGTVTLRWIYLHMIAEYARHNGHADLLRERIDGRTGL
ncbi:MAG: DinB family protein [Micrococcales bacterium]|nr:DinB family protein [Micrococcales bacterium]